MADQKISDMTAATEVANADLIPIVQGGNNFKASKAVLLKGAAGEITVIEPGAGGKIRVTSADGTSFLEIDGSNNVFLFCAGTTITVSYKPGTPSDFNGTAPISLGEAVDRITTVVKALNGGVGP